jgi:hypothetical protein
MPDWKEEIVIVSFRGGAPPTGATLHLIVVARPFNAVPVGGAHL